MRVIHTHTRSFPDSESLRCVCVCVCSSSLSSLVLCALFVCLCAALPAAEPTGSGDRCSRTAPPTPSSNRRLARPTISGATARTFGLWMLRTELGTHALTRIGLITNDRRSCVVVLVTTTRSHMRSACPSHHTPYTIIMWACCTLHIYRNTRTHAHARKHALTSAQCKHVWTGLYGSCGWLMAHATTITTCMRICWPAYALLAGA